ncbi:MAG TPA: FG-GAP repeat protein, partial [Lacipirellula sp.]
MLASLVNAGPAPSVIKLLPSDGAAGDEFGVDVDISQGRAIVGSRFNDDAGENSGSAYLFNAETGSQLHKLTANDAAAGDWFGISAAISGTTAVVGAYQNDARGNNAGAAYVFDATTGTQLRKLTATDAAPGDNLGITAAIDGNLAIFGAYLDDNRGSAYVFNTTTGQQVRKLAPVDLSTQAFFGAAVDIAGNLALIGANADDAQGNASGSAYLYNVSTGARLFKLLPDDGG